MAPIVDRALFEGGYLHGRELPNIFARTVTVPSQSGEYRWVGKLENGKDLFRWFGDE